MKKRGSYKKKMRAWLFVRYSDLKQIEEIVQFSFDAAVKQRGMYLIKGGGK